MAAATHGRVKELQFLHAFALKKPYLKDEYTLTLPKSVSRKSPPSSDREAFEDDLVTVNLCVCLRQGRALMGPDRAKHHLHSPPHLASSKHGTDASAIMMKRAPRRR